MPPSPPPLRSGVIMGVWSFWGCWARPAALQRVNTEVMRVAQCSTVKRERPAPLNTAHWMVRVVVRIIVLAKLAVFDDGRFVVERWRPGVDAGDWLAIEVLSEAQADLDHILVLSVTPNLDVDAAILDRELSYAADD